MVDAAAGLDEDLTSRDELEEEAASDGGLVVVVAGVGGGGEGAAGEKGERMEKDKVEGMEKRKKEEEEVPWPAWFLVELRGEAEMVARVELGVSDDFTGVVGGRGRSLRGWVMKRRRRR